MGEGNWSRANGEEDLLGCSEANRSQCLQTQTVSDPILLGHWELEWLSQDLVLSSLPALENSARLVCPRE